MVRRSWIHLIPPIPKALGASTDFFNALEVAVLVCVLSVVFSGHPDLLGATGALAFVVAVGVGVEGNAIRNLPLLVRRAEECQILGRVAVSDGLGGGDLPILHNNISTCLWLLQSCRLADEQSG